jgi:hypothetical protein
MAEQQRDQVRNGTTELQPPTRTTNDVLMLVRELALLRRDWRANTISVINKDVSVSLSELDNRS